MRQKTRESMENLFCARWNLPTAAKHCDLTEKETKLTFAVWCETHPPTYKGWSEVVQLSIPLNETK